MGGLNCYVRQREDGGLVAKWTSSIGTWWAAKREASYGRRANRTPASTTFELPDAAAGLVQLSRFGGCHGATVWGTNADESAAVVIRFVPLESGAPGDLACSYVHERAVVIESLRARSRHVGVTVEPILDQALPTDPMHIAVGISALEVGPCRMWQQSRYADSRNRTVTLRQFEALISRLRLAKCSCLARTRSVRPSRSSSRSGSLAKPRRSWDCSTCCSLGVGPSEILPLVVPT